MNVNQAALRCILRTLLSERTRSIAHSISPAKISQKKEK